MPGKLHFFKFYPDAWLSDERLRSCSVAARGLWIDLLSLMSKNCRRGFLTVGPKPATNEQIARMTGLSTEQVTDLLTELLTAGVFTSDEHGTIFSRRMVADEKKRILCSRAGIEGGGNPALATFIGQPKGGVKGISNLYPLISSGEGKGGLGGKEEGALADRSIVFWERIAVILPEPKWYLDWAVRHAGRFSLWYDSDPNVIADWWRIFSKAKISESELEDASCRLLLATKQPKGRPDHPRMLLAIVKAAKPDIVRPICQCGKARADFPDGLCWHCHRKASVGKDN